MQTVGRLHVERNMKFTGLKVKSSNVEMLKSRIDDKLHAKRATIERIYSKKTR